MNEFRARRKPQAQGPIIQFAQAQGHQHREVKAGHRRNSLIYTDRNRRRKRWCKMKRRSQHDIDMMLKMLKMLKDVGMMRMKDENMERQRGRMGTYIPFEICYESDLDYDSFMANTANMANNGQDVTWEQTVCLFLRRSFGD